MAAGALVSVRRSTSFPLLWRGLLVVVTTVMLAAAASQLVLACGEPAERTDVSVFLTASEFVVGTNRFPFAVVTSAGVTIDQAEIDVRFSLIDRGSRHFRHERTAGFREVVTMRTHVHEDDFVHNHLNARSYYVVDDVEFDTAGFWSADLAVTPPDASTFLASAAFTVTPQPSALGVGVHVPLTTHPTLRDVSDVTVLSTAENPVVEMYEATVADVLAEGQPLVVQFSTPLFCTSSMCGPVYEEVASLHKRYGDRVRFIHLEPFNLSIARSEGRLVPMPHSREWGLETEPWVFVIDSSGVVRARFQGLVAASEIEAAIDQVLH